MRRLPVAADSPHRVDTHQPTGAGLQSPLCSPLRSVVAPRGSAPTRRSLSAQALRHTVPTESPHRAATSLGYLEEEPVDLPHTHPLDSQSVLGLSCRRYALEERGALRRPPRLNRRLRQASARCLPARPRPSDLAEYPFQVVSDCVHHLHTMKTDAGKFTRPALSALHALSLPNSTTTSQNKSAGPPAL